MKIEIESFLNNELALELHPDKVEIRKFSQGIDFLGYVVLPYHIVLRTKTKRRMFKKLFAKQKSLNEGLLEADSYHQSVQSYLGMLKHCNAHDMADSIKNNFLNTSTWA
ncbi:MAG: hypothetical protein A3C85_03830 [Candidatus Doudnabacteria bacterium RIFCSPHIGHO2_02_FULL_48_21]|uniref:Uncharacterized protein n=1 Tax=Candidatus Doudnabacteria bacterium RIFCSPLOWO2_02_FULL_48_13 TaxID=1817845 RepID=A0A1F5QCR5_9BACT|nr:MAG: hypothetical protein A3K05_03325 [Candidatus Doudnabacteria bacterium RIFCSPHIGHO2_01_48_18]OGE77167.1 MAG: hypothetical protein A2668_01645 [Candidatus Doudnabacteria bacterium RIFCSPHIGHO2_01_FULL_48_180]OGE91772.1 MAG: hypothetical protein A3F44_00170 [Candidatus Doudnabacteria bacterium RIFCSPHIGHO2_12_FULL_47_25]OGE93585.1 MAG: hypothetical protein A3C85_03830 [Candidatus Doudnabacteria bacterium RIFCSPHIGHO2_02_FULL_48_21]OGE96517.1 MAG: hypothetical protein A3A83_04290 [Candidatu